MSSFKQPVKGDLDQALSLLMHEARQKMAAEAGRIKVEMAANGLVESTAAISKGIGMADLIHKDLMKRAGKTLIEFAEQMQGTPLEDFVGWARPHLDNISNVLLGHIPPSNLFGHRDKAIAQYQAAFKQRVEATLRNAEIGYSQQEGFAARIKAREEEWISAAEAYEMVGGFTRGAAEKICRGAHAGLIRARAARLIVREQPPSDDVAIDKNFWWAEGHEALTQDWRSGDFETWLKNGGVRYRVYGVTFLKGDVERIAAPPKSKEPKAPGSTKAPGGRPPANWWDDLWIEVCRQVYAVELQPKRAADITKAMQTWIESKGFEAADSTVKERARKLWAVIEAEDKKSSKPFPPLSS